MDLVTDLSMSNSEAFKPPVPTSEQQNASDPESELEEGEYYNYRIRGKHERLNVFNRRPLFILKETWDDTPPPPRRGDHFQVFDDHTKLMLEVYSRENLGATGCALVERRTPAPTEEITKGFTEHIIGYIIVLAHFVLRDKLFRFFPKALLREGVEESSDEEEAEEEDEEVLLGYSSDEEDNYPEIEERDKYTTVYHPLIRRPATRSREVHSKLLGVLTNGPEGMARLAEGIVGEMMRADDMPKLDNCF